MVMNAVVDTIDWVLHEFTEVVVRPNPRGKSSRTSLRDSTSPLRNQTKHLLLPTIRSSVALRVLF